MFNICLWYDNKKIEESVVNTRFKNCGKTTDLSVKYTNYKGMVTKFVLNTVLHHVGFSWIIESNQLLEHDIDKYNPDWLPNGPWYNTCICTELNGRVFEKYTRNAITDRYNIMCSIYEHKTKKSSYVDRGSSGDGKSIPSNLTTEALYSLGATFDFIDCGIKCFNKKYQY